MQDLNLEKSPSPTAKELLAKIRQEEKEAETERARKYFAEQIEKAEARTTFIGQTNTAINAALAEYDNARAIAESALLRAFTLAAQLPPGGADRLTHLRRVHLPAAVSGPNDILHPICSSMEQILQAGRI